MSKGLKIAIVTGCFVIVGLLATVIVLLVGNRKTESVSEKRNVVVSDKNVEQVVQGLAQEEYVEPGYYETSMATTWNFSNGSAISDNAYVRNVAGNTNDVYLDVSLADNDEVIYKSPVIPRGETLTGIALDKELEAGTYDCVATYHLVDEEQNTVSTLMVAITIVVGG